MSRRRPVGGACLFAIVSAGVLAASAGATVRLKSVDLSGYPVVRATVVTSAGSTGAPRLTENGAAVQGFSAQRLQAKSVVLAVDRSRSMRGLPLARATEAARAFVAAKPADDRIALVSFGRTALELTSFSSSTIDVDSGLRTLGVDWMQGTALYDAVAVAASMLGSEPTRARILVLLTDGRDVSSSVSLRQALAAARRAHVAVYAIGIRGGAQYTPRPLRALARATGGTYYSTADTRRLARLYGQVSAELRRTWLLEYATAARPGERLRLRVTVPGSGRAVTAITVPAGRGAGHAANGFRSHWWAAAILGGIAGLVVLLVASAALSFSRRTRLRAQLEPYVGPEALAGERRPTETERLAVLAPLFGVTERALAGLRVWSKLERQLVRADLPLRTVELVYVMFGCALALGLVAAVGGLGPLGVLILGSIGLLGPYLAVSIKARKRLAAFEQQLPAALNTLAASLKAGHSFTQAVQGLVEGGGPPVDGEFRRVLAEARLGHPMDAALAGMGERVGSKELDFVLRAVVIQRQVGGSLAGLFELVAETVARRHQFRQKIKSLTAMGRLSAGILIALPIGVALMITATSPDYMDPLYATHAGHIIIALALSMMLVGSLVLRQIVSFKG